MTPRTRLLCTSVAVLVVVAAVPTFVVDGILNGTPVMNGSARGTALVMLVVALPVLVLGMVTSGRRGSPPGRAALLGALGYLTYNAALLVYATPFNELFLVYVALLGLSFWSMVSALIEPHPPLVADALPARGIAAFILVVVGLNALAWLRFVVPDLGEDPPGFLAGTGLTTNPIHVQDLAFWLPAMAIVAVLLWQRRPSGVFLAGAGLIFWAIESIGVAVDQWFGQRAAPGSDLATSGGVVLFAVLAAATAVPLALWLRAVTGRTRHSSAPTAARTPTTHSTRK
jgi:hypothetical protein